jgi:hypothetical protein
VPRRIIRATPLFDKFSSLRDKYDEFVKGFPAVKQQQRIVERGLSNGSAILIGEKLR